ncbi:hypothetical protein FRC02_010548 [Tulasnella sp. 418]|nr:hypothetical protein FRC02_010548 [Tulasnella sp. 418]
MRAFLEGRLRTRSDKNDSISGPSSPILGHIASQSQTTGPLTPQKIHPDLQALVSSPSRRSRARSVSAGYRTESAHARTRSDMDYLQTPSVGVPRIASVPALSQAFQGARPLPNTLAGLFATPSSSSSTSPRPYARVPSPASPSLSPPPATHVSRPPTRLNSSQDLTPKPATDSALPDSPSKASLDSVSSPPPGSHAGNRSSGASYFSRSNSESPPPSITSSKAVSSSTHKRFSVSAVTHSNNDTRLPTSPARVSFISQSTASNRNTIGSQSQRSSHSPPTDADRSSSRSKTSSSTRSQLRRSASPPDDSEVKTPPKSISLPSMVDRASTSTGSSRSRKSPSSPDLPTTIRQSPPFPSLTSVLGAHANNNSTPSDRRQSAFWAAKNAETGDSKGWERKVAEEMIALSMARRVPSTTSAPIKKEGSQSSKKSRRSTVSTVLSKSSSPKESSSTTIKKSPTEPISASATFGVLTPTTPRSAVPQDNADEFGETKASAPPAKKPRNGSFSSGKSRNKENGNRTGSVRSGGSGGRAAAEKVHVRVVDESETGEGKDGGIVESWKLEMDIPNSNLDLVSGSVDLKNAELFKFIKEKEIITSSPLESKTPNAKRWRVRKRTLSSGNHVGGRRRTLTHRASSSSSINSPINNLQNQELPGTSPAITVFTVSTPDMSFGNTTTTSTVDENGTSAPTTAVTTTTDSVIPEEPHSLPVLPMPSRSRLRSDASQASSSRTSVSATGSPMPKRLSAAAMDSQSLFFGGGGGGGFLNSRGGSSGVIVTSRFGGSGRGTSQVAESDEEASSSKNSKGKKRLGGGESDIGGDELDRDIVTPEGEPYERQRKESIVEDDVLGELPVNPRKRLKVASNPMRVQSLGTASISLTEGQSPDERRNAGDPFFISTPGAGPSRYSPPNKTTELKGILTKQPSEGSYKERERDRNELSRPSSRRSQSVSFSTAGGFAGRPTTPGHPGRSPTDSSFTSTVVGSGARRRHSTPWSESTVGGTPANGVGGRIPVMAILSPRPPSFVATGSGGQVYHMREPRRYSSRASASARNSMIRGQSSFSRDRRISSREMLDEDLASRDLRSPTSEVEFGDQVEVRSRSRGWTESLPLQGWAFFVGFLLPFCWWIAAFTSVRGFGGIKDDVEGAGGETYTLQDIVTWRRRCRLMSGFSILVYVPVITLAVIFGR